MLVHQVLDLEGAEGSVRVSILEELHHLILSFELAKVGPLAAAIAVKTIAKSSHHFKIFTLALKVALV